VTDSRDPELDRAARALALVLDLEADDLREDTPLDDLGADAMARIQWADVVEETADAQGTPRRVEDAALASAVTLGDLADHLRSLAQDDPATGSAPTGSAPTGSQEPS
jgi:acyl carrier protein